MDRLSEYARTVVEDYRDHLSPKGRRIERNWDAIERRALAEGADDGACEPELDAVRKRRVRWGIPLAVAMVACACAALVVEWRPVADSGPRAISDDTIAEARHAEAAPSAALEACVSEATHACTVKDSEVLGSLSSSSSFSPRGPREAALAEPQGVPLIAPAIPLEPSRVMTTVLQQAGERTMSEPDVHMPRAKRHRRQLPTSRPSSTRVIDEIALVRRARVALRDGDAAAALRTLDEHARQFGAGEFTEEATVLRIAALCRGGSVTAGRKLQRTFLAVHARSPLAGQAAHACPEASSDR